MIFRTQPGGGIRCRWLHHIQRVPMSLSTMLNTRAHVASEPPALLHTEKARLHLFISTMSALPGYSSWLVLSCNPARNERWLLEQHCRRRKAGPAPVSVIAPHQLQRLLWPCANCLDSAPVRPAWQQAGHPVGSHLSLRGRTWSRLYAADIHTRPSCLTAA